MVENNHEIIDFYSSTKAFFELSNFFFSAFTLDLKEWPTIEHYFQAQKSLDENVKERIRALTTPGEAKSMGRKVILRSDWNDIKIEVMKKGCRAKFTQNDSLKKLLLSTGDKKLREHTANDKFWGDGGGDGKGENMMGRILMILREELRKEKK